MSNFINLHYLKVPPSTSCLAVVHSILVIGRLVGIRFHRLLVHKGLNVTAIPDSAVASSLPVISPTS